MIRAVGEPVRFPWEGNAFPYNVPLGRQRLPLQRDCHRLPAKSNLRACESAQPSHLLFGLNNDLIRFRPLRVAAPFLERATRTEQFARFKMLRVRSPMM